MFVIKRDQTQAPVRYDTITDRNIDLAHYPTKLNVDPARLSQLVIQSLKNGMTTEQIDLLSAETAYFMSTYEPDYDTLAMRIVVSNLHKTTKSVWSDTITQLYNCTHKSSGKRMNIIGDDFMNFVKENQAYLNSIPQWDRDYTYTYFGFKTLERAYLLKIDSRTIERPQGMLLRVAVQVHYKAPLELNERLSKIRQSYDLMSKFYFTHASPTVFNSGASDPQLASCYLLHTADDMDHIYETIKRCALISKKGGGIGVDISSVRAKGSLIHSSGGKSDGLVPLAQVFNATARYSNQEGKRKGSFALYLQPWHPDVFEFLALRHNTPPEELRARDVFLGLWVPDLFMKRVEQDAMWSLICPLSEPRLTETYGEEFEQVYLECESQGKFTRQVRAREVWEAVLTSQEETGLPYMLYKDSINRKSNQKNIGIIRSSNLCTEIVEYTDPDNVAVCNLSSLGLPAFVEHGEQGPWFNFVKLGEVVEHITENLNRVIDVNYYPIAEARNNNLKYRPIGIGIQGLSDVFAMFKTPWDSEIARDLNRCVFETIYYHALKKSAELAEREGSYSAFEGSPVSQGVLQYHMWNQEPWTARENPPFGHKLDWDWLIQKAKHGIRNSLLVAPMPTATTAQIMGNTESFEVCTSNIYSRSVLSGNFIIVNKWLYRELTSLGLWNKSLVDQIIEGDGSIQHIKEIPQNVKDVYRTVWELSQRVVIDMAADRGAFIDQSQSLNIHIAHPTHAGLSSMHMYAWKRGLKTGMYYLRSKPSRGAVKFTILKDKQTAQKKCDGDSSCEMCSS